MPQPSDFDNVEDYKKAMKEYQSVIDAAKKLYLYDEGGEYLSSSGSALTIASGGIAWELPTADGSANQVLKTDSSGNLDWVSVSSLGAVTALNNATANEVVTVASTTTELDAESALTFSSEILTIGDDDNGNAGLVRKTHSDGAGGSLVLSGGAATGEDLDGGNISFVAGTGTGDADGGVFLFKSHVGGSSGTSAGTAASVFQINANGGLQIGTAADGTDRTIKFNHSTLSTIMGIDDSADNFIINTDAAFDGTLANNSFTIDASHNVGIGGNLDIQGNTISTAGNIELATGGSGNITLDAAGIIYHEATSTQLTSGNDSAHNPLLLLTNTANDATGARIKLYKNRGADGQDGDSCGVLHWASFDDGTPSGQEYGQIETKIHDATNGQESGLMEFGVANHDGGVGTGLSLTGGSANDEIDVTIGLGADSVTTVTGHLTVNGKECTLVGRKFATTETGSAGDYNGDVVYFGGTTEMTVGRIYHYKSDGTWEIANADAIATSDGLLAVALGAASDTNGMLLRGMVTLDHDPGAVGDVLYVQSDNAGTTGHATVTAPSASGDCVRVVGYCLHASAGLIWFNPDNTFIEVS